MDRSRNKRQAECRWMLAAYKRHTLDLFLYSSVRKFSFGRFFVSPVRDKIVIAPRCENPIYSTRPESRNTDTFTHIHQLMKFSAQELHSRSFVYFKTSLAICINQIYFFKKKKEMATTITDDVLRHSGSPYRKQIHRQYYETSFVKECQQLVDYKGELNTRQESSV